MKKIVGIILALVMLCGAAVLFITDRVLDSNLDEMTRTIEEANRVYGSNKDKSAPNRIVRDEFRKDIISDF